MGTHRKQFAVIGLGTFGSSVAQSLEKLGSQVLGIDRDEERVQDMAPVITQAIVADATEDKALRSLGLKEMDGIIISIGEHMESSILITLLLKELGAKNIMVKGLSELHGRVLAKVGADRVLFPEQDMALKLVESLVSPNILEEIQLSPDYNIMEIVSPKDFTGKTMKSLELRAKYGVNVIAIKKKVPFLTDGGDTDFKEEINIAPAADDEVNDGDILVIIGKNADLDVLKNL
ncbi:MAG TPA: TrkA family potassium uptake protein [Elusimicrobiota bacterium]|nr:TrkA family potassium uptake protein [Elusimicrobiota bacterium]